MTTFHIVIIWKRGCFKKLKIRIKITAMTVITESILNYSWSFISPSLIKPRRFIIKWKKRLRTAGAIK